MLEKTSDQNTSVMIDGVDLQGQKSQTILELMFSNGIQHPHVCYHPSLGAIETCDSCIVEMNGELVCSCSTSIKDGMKIQTQDKWSAAARTEAMNRMLENHMLCCTVCDNNNGNCTFHNTVKQMAIENQCYPFRDKGDEVDQTNPFYRYDPDQCITCGRCVGACQDLQVNETLSITWEEDIPRVIWDNGVPIDESSCVSCGHCVTVCPTNALMEKSMLGETGTLTGLKTELLNPMNGVSTCVKGKFGRDFANSKERLTKPLVRAPFYETNWDEALTLVATKMQETKDTYGSDALGFISPSKITNEENYYLMQKLSRSVTGTNNVDNYSRYCQSPATDGLMRTVGYGGDSGTIEDISKASLVLVIGTNPAEAHPVLATRVKRAQKLHGQKLVIVDMRRHELAERADLFVRPNQGTDHVWLSAITKYIIDEGWHDEEFLKEHVHGFNDLVTNLAPFTLEYAEQLSGIDSQTLIEIAAMLKDADSVAALWAMGVTQHSGGSNTSGAISNLMLMTGNFGKPGCGVFPLRGHNNIQGACDFGTLPSWFPGYQDVSDERIRKKFEDAWGTTLSGIRGKDNHEMVASIHADKMKAMYLNGEETAWVDTNSNYVQEALTKLGFLVVQDIFFTNPASPSLAKEGIFTNTERRIQRLSQVLLPLADSKPDWAIIMDVANRLGAHWYYESPADIMAEAATLTPLFAGVSYERLEGCNSLVWPVAPDGTDTPLLYTDGFAFSDKKAHLVMPDWVDLVLNNGRLLEHFHEGNLTYKSSGLQKKVPRAFVEVSSQLAKERGMKDGSVVLLESPEGAVKVNVVVTDRVRHTEVFLPMNSTDDEYAINLLTGNPADIRTNTPVFKETYGMKVLNMEGMRPLPRTNHRYGQRNPQRGVEVEREWNRLGYESVQKTVERRLKHG